jgi:hypothetical protein
MPEDELTISSPDSPEKTADVQCSAVVQEPDGQGRIRELEEALERRKHLLLRVKALRHAAASGHMWNKLLSDINSELLL